MSFGKMYLSAVLEAGSVTAFFKDGDISHLLTADEGEAYEFVREFAKKHHAIPQLETIEQHTGQALMPHKEPATFYVELLRERYTERTMKKAMQDASEFFKPDKKNASEVVRIMAESIMRLATDKQSSRIVDFRDAFDIMIPDYVSKWNKQGSNGLQLGWPTLDEMSGGLVSGDLMSIVGRPAAGKTWQLMYAALNGWKNPVPEVDSSRLIVSMEMNPLAIIQRLTALYTHLPSKQVKDANLSTANVQHMKAGLAEIRLNEHPLWILDGNLAATVEDIYSVARQLKPAAIFLDGGYLVKHPTVRDRYQRVAENADLMKQELAPIAPTVVSWQFAKSAGKKDKKKGEKVTMDDIGYTDAIAQVSSLVAGVFEDESIETIKCRIVEILKGRNGETGRFKTNWDFQHMDFREQVEQDVSALQFI